MPLFPSSYSVVELVRDLIVIATAGMGFWSLGAWRREMLGKRRIELAENVLAHFYQARDVIPSVRSPLSFSSETETRKRADNETSAQARIFDVAHVALTRLDSHRELFAGTESLKWRMEALCGPSAKEPFDLLFRSRHKVFAAAATMVACARSHSTEWGTVGKFEKVLYGAYQEGEKDEVAELLAEAVAAAERLCRPIIAEERSLQTVLWRRRSAKR